MKIFSYEIFEGDKGVILAHSEEEAKAFLSEDYPEREVTRDLNDYMEGAILLKNEGNADRPRIVAAFPWV